MMMFHCQRTMMRFIPLRLSCLPRASYLSLRGIHPAMVHARTIHNKRTKHISPTTKKNEFETSIPKIIHAPKPAKAPSTAVVEDEETHHAVVSTFDLFSIGVGPSSSHTIGPMRASKIFINDLLEHGLLEKVDRLIVDLYGSLALTGIGHNTPSAILMGMEGETPEAVVTELITPRTEQIAATNTIRLNGTHAITFNPSKDIKFHPKPLPQHPNGMRFSVFEKGTGSLLATNDYFSVGGGFVVNEATRVAHGENAFYMAYDKEHVASSRKSQDVVATTAALPFTNCDDLIAICKQQNITIAQVVYQNELQWHSPEEIKRQLLAIWSVMDNSIRSGVMSSRSHLPGSLKVRRRAPELYRKLQENMWSITAGISRHSSLPSLPLSESNSTSVEAAPSSSSADAVSDVTNVASILPAPRTRRRLLLPALDYLSVYAIAVNEENAAGGRVVTAPTLGSAGVIPSVLLYYLEFISETPEADIMEFLLTSAAIGMLYKRGSSISASEMGCMGEVGVACSMAAAAFTAVLGGTVEQVERAAEIGMEHNLGLTCDPIAGLVQIPCIERNAIGAVKAVCAAQLALNGDGKGRVTLDQVIRTMRETGNEMSHKFKETSLGGLAVNVPAC